MLKQYESDCETYETDDCARRQLIVKIQLDFENNIFLCTYLGNFRSKNEKIRLDSELGVHSVIRTVKLAALSSASCLLLIGRRTLALFDRSFRLCATPPGPRPERPSDPFRLPLPAVEVRAPFPRRSPTACGCALALSPRARSAAF